MPTSLWERFSGLVRSMFLAAGQGTPNMILYNTTPVEQIQTFSVNNIDSGIFSSDGKRIQTHKSAEKCTVKLWDTATGKEIHTFIAEHDLLDMTPNFLTTISPDDTNDHNFILWTSFTPEERAALKTIETDLNLHQAHFLYQLYNAKLSKSPLSANVTEKITSLPQNTQNMITQYLTASPSNAELTAAFEEPKSVTAIQPPQTWWQSWRQWLRGQ